jgi:outer membrane receptor protein involved in Fe transport
MNSHPKLPYAIAAVLSGPLSALAPAAVATDADTSNEIQDITVAAQRRVEKSQNMPITIQALTADTLQQLNATTLPAPSPILGSSSRTRRCCART